MAEPAITIRAAHDSGPGNLPYTRVVVHATCPGTGYPKASEPGSAHGTALYFATQAAGGSTQYVCDSVGEEHCVPDDYIAWGAPPNPHSVHVEICGEASYTRDEWLSDTVWPGCVRAAHRVRELCDRGSLPLEKLTAADLLAGKHGICGHVDVSQAWHQTNHTDPGPNFPWDRFMAEVQNPQEDDMTGAEHQMLQDLHDRLGKVDLALWAILGDKSNPSIRGVLTTLIAKQLDPAALATAIVAALPANGGDLTADQIKQAVKAALAEVVNAGAGS